MAVNTLTLYMPGSSVGIQVYEGSQLHEILVSQGANSIQSAPGETVRQDPFPQYVDDEELAAALSGVGGGYTDGQAVAAVEDAATVAPSGAWAFTQAPTVGGVPLGSGAVASVNGETGAVSLSVADLDDFDATTPPEDGQVLAWNDATTKFAPTNLPPSLEVVEHGANSGTTRPAAGRVLWLGSVVPANMLAGDIYFEVTGGAPAWSPSDAADLALWYDAQSLALADGATTTTWADRSAFGRGLTATTGSATFDADGLNGHPALAFGGACYMDSTTFTGITGPITLLAVAQMDDIASTRMLVDGPNGTSRVCIFKASTGLQDTWGISRNSLLYAANGLADPLPHMFRMVLGNAGGSSLAVDGVEIIAPGNAGGATITALRVAGSNAAVGMTGRIGEIIMYARELDAAEISSAEAYLTAKWSL